MWPIERFYLGRLRRELLAAARGPTLEIGAGTGANLAHYAGAARPVLSEPDGAMLERARRGGTAAVMAAAERLAFADGAVLAVRMSQAPCFAWYFLSRS